MITMSPSRSVTLYILSPAWISAALITVPFSRQGFLHAELPLNLLACWYTLTMSTITPRVANGFRCSRPSRVMLFWVMNLPIAMTLPSLISAAAAFVTAGVMRFVAPVWSFGPQGDAGTRVLQSVWANAEEPRARSIRAAPTATIALGFMADTPSRQ